MIRTTCFIFVGLRLCHRSSFVIHVSLHRVLSRSQSKILTSQTCSVIFQILSSKSSLDTNFNFFIQQKCSHSFTMMFFRSHKRLGYRRGDTPPSMMLQKIPLSYLLSENARHLQHIPSDYTPGSHSSLLSAFTCLSPCLLLSLPLSLLSFSVSPTSTSISLQHLPSLSLTS